MHEQIHASAEQQTEFKCQLCSKPFASPESLNAHLVAKHNQEESVEIAADFKGIKLEINTGPGMCKVCGQPQHEEGVVPES